MKKITLILAVFGMMTLSSCSKDDDVDNDTISEVWEYSLNVNYLASNNYTSVLFFPHPIYTSDMVLLYRLDDVVNGQDVWKPMPQTFYFNDGTLDFRYDFSFTTTKATTYLEGYDLEGISLAFRTNQVIRVVVVPGFFGKTAEPLKSKEYKDVVKQFNIQENKIVKIK
ncbi:MAG: hypothetical protein QM710_00365 [Flavobacterium sp.]